MRTSTGRDPGRRIAVVRGSSGEEYVRRNLRQAEIVVFADSDAAAAALAKGRVEGTARIALSGSGADEQRALLLAEGIEVSAEGTVDLARYGREPNT